MSRGKRTHTEADYWLAVKWAEVRGLYYLFVLTRWHIYSSGVHAKLIWHGARDSQVGSGHDFDPVGYSSVGKGTLIQLNEKRNGLWRACTSDFSTEWNHIYFQERERWCFSTDRGRCWIGVWLRKRHTVCVSGIRVSQDNFRTENLPTPFFTS